MADPAAAPAAAAPSADDLGLVLSYVEDVRPDDGLLQVRPGVFAKRSNAQVALRVAAGKR